MKYLYILLLCLIIYYIISRFYEKYTENFDPSLVPVSSIVTLSKIANKIIDNNTLINPANLNIGTSNTTGNLSVSGNITNSGDMITNGKLTVGGSINSGYALDVKGTSNITSNTNIGGTLGIGGSTTIGTLGTPTSSNLTVNGNGTITGNTIINGKITFANDVWHNSMDNQQRLFFTSKGDTKFDSPQGWIFQNSQGTQLAKIDQNANLTLLNNSADTYIDNNLLINRKLNIDRLCIGSTCISDNVFKYYNQWIGRFR